MVLEHLAAPQTLFNVLAGGAMLVLAAVLLHVDRRNRLHQAFALFLVVRGLTNVGTGFANVPVEAVAFVGRSVSQPFGMATVFAAFLFLVVYRDRYRPDPRHRFVALALVAVGLVVVGAYLVDPALVATFAWADGFIRTVQQGPLSFVFLLTFPAYAAVALVFARDAGTAPTAPRRRSLLLLTTAFALDALYRALVRPLTLLIAPSAPPSGTFSYPWQTAVSDATVLALLAAAAWFVWRGGVRDGEARDRRLSLRLLALWGSAAASAAVVPVLGAALREVGVRIFWAFDGVWTLALPLLASYALVRHQLFGIDLRAKWAVKQSTVAAAFVAVVLVATEGAQILFGEQNAWIGLVAAAALVFALAPLQRVAERVAQAAMPDAKPVGEMDDDERHAAYREMVLAAWEDGTLTRAERRVLDVARERLGLTAEEAQRLEAEAVRAPA